MADTNLIDCGPATIVNPGDVMRVAFTESVSIMLDSGFAGKFANVYDKLKASTAYLPMSPNAAVQGNVVAVEDIKYAATPKSIAEVLADLEMYCGWFVRVQSLQVLDMDAASNSQTDVGAAERNAVATDGENKAQADSTFSKIADALGLAVGTIKWVAIAVVIIVLLVVAMKAKGAAKTAIAAA